jgi:hypothetical protein
MSPVDRMGSRYRRRRAQEAVNQEASVKVVSRDRPRRVDAGGLGVFGARCIEGGEGPALGRSGHGRSGLLSARLQAFQIKRTPDNLLKNRTGTRYDLP